MHYQQYAQLAQRASQLVEQGDYAGASQVLHELLSSDISDLDKSVMCLNLAIVCDKQGQIEQALTWYERGIDYERRHSRCTVREKKAAYLVAKGRFRESFAIYEDLLAQGYLTESDKERIRQNLTILRRRV